MNAQLVLLTLDELEAKVERGLSTFKEVGEALLQIHDRRLYQDDYGTWEEYMLQRWGWTRDYGYKLVRATKAVLSGDVDHGIQTERETRAILSAARAIKTQRRQERDEQRIEQRAAVLESEHPLNGASYSVFVHDIRDGAPDMGAPSVVITDPPYPEEYVDLYGDLDFTAAALLPDGGSLLAMCGQSHLPRITATAGGNLRYQWILNYYTPGQSTQVFGRFVKANWKPVLWYVNGTYSGEHIDDTIRSDGNDKRFHEWGQSVSGMAALIERFTVPGDLVYDPFCGGGTTGVAALLTGRLFVGSDIDEACVKQTAARLAEVT